MNGKEWAYKERKVHLGNRTNTSHGARGEEISELR